MTESPLVEDLLFLLEEGSVAIVDGWAHHLRNILLINRSLLTGFAFFFPGVKLNVSINVTFR